MSGQESSGYRWDNAELTCSHDYLLPALLRELRSRQRGRLFDLGCGNGSVASVLAQRGWDVTGVDPSAEGITTARLHYPHLKLYAGSAYEDLSAKYGRFPVVISLEVVEHVYFPRKYAAT